MGSRLDIYLVTNGDFPSRAKAREAIDGGLVYVNGAVVRKASLPVHEEDCVSSSPAYPWVSRGGVKLAGALDRFGVICDGMRVLDVGASTGGFCDVLLSRGAQRVVCVDVGHDQLHPKLRNDPRVTFFEGQDVRSLRLEQVGGLVDLVVMDVSFVSSTVLLEHVLTFLKPNAIALVLIKPQFENPDRLALNDQIGLKCAEAARNRICTLLGKDFEVSQLEKCQLRGGDGMQEYWIKITS